MSTFEALGLDLHLLRSVQDLGFAVPTPIQAAAIPAVLAGRDLAAEAQTGSGKTAAFVLPLLQRFGGPSSPTPRVLTLAPTRELALQVADVFRSLASWAPHPIRVLGLIGGEPVEHHIATLAKGVEVVVATPGRLLDLIERGALDLRGLEVLVLDEADKLLDLGFSDQLDAVLAAIPADRQTLLFSATLPQRVLDLSASALRDPVTVRIDDAPAGPTTIHQRVIGVDRDRRRMLLEHLLRTEGWDRTLVFVATQRACANLAVKLRKAGVRAGALHGGLEQADRVRVLARFKGGRAAVLVATDLAARGIDVPQLDAVVNFDLPRSPRDYLHRIGRTGRAGAVGTAISFVDHTSAAHFRVIEKRSGVALEREQVAGFELSGPPPERRPGPPPTKGRRPSKKDKLRAKAARDEAAAREAAERGES